MNRHLLEFKEMQITPEVIISELGYSNGISPDSYVFEKVNYLLSEIDFVTHPKCFFRMFDGEIYSTEIQLNNNVVLHTGSVITYLLKGSTRFALFVATAGQEFQFYFDSLKMKGDMLETFIVDTIGSLIAERAGDLVELLLEREIGNEKHTNRFSPGYCGWKLSNQKEIFSLMGNNPCSITLSDVFLMDPIKSISGIIGIGEKVNEKIYGCKFCELESCYKRKK